MDLYEGRLMTDEHANNAWRTIDLLVEQMTTASMRHRFRSLDGLAMVPEYRESWAEVPSVERGGAAMIFWEVDEAGLGSKPETADAGGAGRRGVGTQQAAETMADEVESGEGRGGRGSKRCLPAAAVATMAVAIMIRVEAEGAFVEFCRWRNYRQIILQFFCHN